MRKGYRTLAYRIYLRLTRRWLVRFRRRLAAVDALPQLALLGIVSGLFTGCVVLLFRWSVEAPLTAVLPAQLSENFEALPSWLHFAVPVYGAVLIALALYFINPKRHRVGLVHVINRYNNHQGNMPVGNALVQFFGGIIALLSGQSVGREGPAIHLGAASSSLMGQWFKLPNNSVRILVGCGVASAISASFNTPIAGVIFAMEVVLMEYTIAGFTPVILASVTGAVISQAFYGADPAFSVPAIHMKSLYEIPLVMVAGFAIGGGAAFFILIQKIALGFQHYAISLRLVFAGLFTGSVAWLVPQIMGVGYDTVQQAILGELGISLLLAIIITKICVTAFCLGLGMPGGVIGPTFVIGACAGGALGIVANALYPQYAATPAFYVMLGMGAMMAACLNAPLAALMAILELTNNAAIILPGMLVIVTANLTRSEIFKQQTVYQSMLSLTNTDVEQHPFAQILQRVGVASIMERDLRVSPAEISLSQAQVLLLKNPKWIVTENREKRRFILKTADLAHYLEELETAPENTPETINLLSIPSGMRKDTLPISVRATLAEAMALLDSSTVDALCVERQSKPLRTPVIGIVQPEDIRDYYQFTPKQSEDSVHTSK